MLARLALLFVVVPLVELVILVRLGQIVGLWPTLGLVVGTGLLGAALARREGARTWLAFQGELAEGRLPGAPLMDGLAVLVGGAFLLTPGLLTDVAGFLLLVPASRRWIRGRMRRWLERRVEEGSVRVVTFGSWGPVAPEAPPRPPDLDPRHEIRPREEPPGQ